MLLFIIQFLDGRATCRQRSRSFNSVRLREVYRKLRIRGQSGSRPFCHEEVDVCPGSCPARTTSARSGSRPQRRPEQTLACGVSTKNLCNGGGPYPSAPSSPWASHKRPRTQKRCQRSTAHPHKIINPSSKDVIAAVFEQALWCRALDFPIKVLYCIIHLMDQVNMAGQKLLLKYNRGFDIIPQPDPIIISKLLISQKIIHFKIQSMF